MNDPSDLAMSHPMNNPPDDLLERFPEINISNYDEDNVSKLNAWGLEAYDLIKFLRTRLEDADRRCREWQRLASEFEKSREVKP